MLEVEQNILGAILMDNEALDKIYDTIRPEMFQSKLYQDIYTEMLYRYDNGEDIELQSLVKSLEDRDRPFDYLSEEITKIIKNVETSAFIKTHADLLVKEWQSREVNSILYNLDLAPKSIDNTISDIMTRLELLQSNTKSESKTIAQIVEENRNNYFNEKVGENNIKTCFYKIDEIIGGLEQGDVTIIAARPACGKSAFATQILRNVAKQGYKVGYFNLEMRESQIYERFVSQRMEHKDGLTRLRCAIAFNTEKEREEFDKINDELKGFNIVVNSSCFTPRAIRNECKYQKFDLIVIDYLQIMTDDKKHNSRNEEVASVSRAIKKLAMELNVHIIVLSQFNRASEGRQDKEPTMAELRESGAIEQDASNIICLWNLNKDKPRYKGVKVEKSRMSETGKVGMSFDGAHMTFTERLGDFYQWEKEAKGNENNYDVIDDMFN